MRTMSRRWVVAILGAIAAASVCASATVQAAPKTLQAIGGTADVGPRQPGFWAGYLYAQLHPNSAPPGANDFGCTPKEGENPVVLVHGTYEDAYDNWAGIAPELAESGRCVFAPNYGRTDLVDKGGVVTILPAANGVASIAQSATQLGRYIDRVRAATGSAKVDVVSHSQGGVVVRQWMKADGGADVSNPENNKVGKLVMLAAPNHGTTLDGLAWIGRQINNAGLDIMGFYAWLYGAGPIDQSVGSPFIKRLNSGRMTYPGVEYTNIASRFDEVVTPYTSAFIRSAGVRNITIQDGCSKDLSDHLTMIYSPRVISLVEGALGGVTNPVCAPHGWLIG
ncbi:alpha/beta fold hydrolase [Gordonia sp. (in: high G+C Gram-positive bacteria)]|uniref:esterase/lipase family protein n=1 Tax=Gordonia sp. (in: high G+C Gram-positive bacteria) TaxID=84139 RepID=UPI00334083B5